MANGATQITKKAVMTTILSVTLRSSLWKKRFQPQTFHGQKVLITMFHDIIRFIPFNFLVIQTCPIVNKSPVCHDGPGHQEQTGWNQEGSCKLPPHPDRLKIWFFRTVVNPTFCWGAVQRHFEKLSCRVVSKKSGNMGMTPRRHQSKITFTTFCFFSIALHCWGQHTAKRRSRFRPWEIKEKRIKLCT